MSRKVGKLTIALIASSLCLPASAAERKDLGGDLSIGGSVRGRYERKDNFGLTQGRDDYFLHQVRLNLQYDPAEQVSIFVEGQDSGITGEAVNMDDSVPNTHSDEFDLHQAHVTYKPSTHVSLKAGRQKLAFADNRLVGSSEWSNTARVYDGLRLSVGKDGFRTLDAFSTAVVPVDPNGFNGHTKSGNRYFDSSFHGLYYSDWRMVSRTQVDWFAFLRDETVSDDSVYTMGLRFDTKVAPFRIDGLLAYQFGDYGKEDQRAYAGHLGGEYGFRYETDHTLGLALNYASGDSDAADGKHETFDNLFPTNHMYYGYMDFFSWMNMREINPYYKVKLHKSLVRLSYHWFWLNEPVNDSWYTAANHNAPLFSYTGSAPGAKSEAGQEIDITVETSHLKSITTLFGYGHFFTGAYVDQRLGSSAQDADYVFGQAKLEF